jgi:glutamate racemase
MAALRSAPIGFFDSGEGGLTVARQVADLLPGERILYACDTANFPYGPRPLHEVRTFVLRFMQFFAAAGCKLVVVACNTATAAIRDLLESRATPVPAIGVVGPGARAAAAASVTGRIGVAATFGTCESGLYPELIRRGRPESFVAQAPCPILVIRAEEGVITGPTVRLEVSACLMPILSEGVDTLILGCTHFPHMAGVIADVCGPGVQLIDPGVATAAEVARWLKANNLENPEGDGARRFCTTGDPEPFALVAAHLWPGGVQAAEKITLPDVWQ